MEDKINLLNDIKVVMRVNEEKIFSNRESNEDHLPAWRNGETQLNEINMNKLNFEIRQKYDGIELDENKRLILKIKGDNRHIINLKKISENNYSNEEKEKVSKINDIEDKLNSLSLDLGTF